MDRMILHSDINACYASIELLRHPELRGRPVAVGGERELRHGIILAKEQMARAAGVRTGMTLWAARHLRYNISYRTKKRKKNIRIR